MGKTVYIGNLSQETTDGQVRDLFAAHGDVTEVRVVKDQYTGRPRGFAFVDMATELGAETAISEVNGKVVDGREVKVAEAKPRGRRDRSHDVYTFYPGR
jgi:RNA recognition motif-containing protein